MMPEMDGLTFLRMIRRSPQWENVPVFVLTGVSDDSRMLARARELRIEEMIPKATFGFDDLLARVRKVLPLPKAAKAG
jgi:CheY-like chemotaxis protein